MGMFDTVWIRCPKCGNQVDFQTKAGDCYLHDYGWPDDAAITPKEILADLDGQEERCVCGATLVPVATVTLAITVK